jgi:hypothetical protein
MHGSEAKRCECGSCQPTTFRECQSQERDGSKYPKKNDFPVSQVRRYLEPGPILLVSSKWKGKTNIMTMGWHTVMEFTPSLVGRKIQLSTLNITCISPRIATLVLLAVIVYCKTQKIMLTDIYPYIFLYVYWKPFTLKCSFHSLKKSPS